MSLEGMISKVGSEAKGPLPLTIGREIFQQYIRKEINFQTYLEMNAVTVAHDASKIVMETFPSLPSTLKTYCEDRISDRRDYEQETGRRLGAWVYQAIRTRENAEANLSLLQWAVEKLESTGLAGEMSNLNEAIQRFDLRKFPHRDFYIATQAQKQDAIARDRTK